MTKQPTLFSQQDDEEQQKPGAEAVNESSENAPSPPSDEDEVKGVEAASASEAPKEVLPGMRNIKEGDETLLPPFSTEEITEAKARAFHTHPDDTQSLVCYSCKEGFDEKRQPILYQGHAYHKACVPFNKDTFSLKDNPRIHAEISLRASTLALLIEVISQVNEDAVETRNEMKLLHDHLADSLCEHNSYYVRCTECGKILMRHEAIVGGMHTRKVKEETNITVSIQSGRFFSRVRSIEVFCCEGHDLNYSRRLYKAWDQDLQSRKKESEEKAKKVAKGRKAKKKESKDQVFRDLFKIAKTKVEVEAMLTEILGSMKVTRRKR